MLSRTNRRDRRGALPQRVPVPMLVLSAFIVLGVILGYVFALRSLQSAGGELKQYFDAFLSGGVNRQDKYNQELIDRFNHGEMIHADSIHFADSLKVQTKRMGRTVYGGGGIMPDFFVPIDTTQYTDYHRNLVAKGVVIKATTGYIEKHRKELQNKYKKFEAFNEKFEIDDNFLAEIRALADKEKIKFDEKQYHQSLPLIKTQLKALIARDLWDMNEYFQVMNNTNQSVQQALKVLNDDIYSTIIQ
mgnify:CR=1 FL=1